MTALNRLLVAAAKTSFNLQFRLPTRSPLQLASSSGYAPDSQGKQREPPLGDPDGGMAPAMSDTPIGGSVRLCQYHIKDAAPTRDSDAPTTAPGIQHAVFP